MKTLTPQHKEILALLKDGRWHCPTVELYMKDDRSRISELNKMGYKILGTKICEDVSHNHKPRSHVKLRMLWDEPKEKTDWWNLPEYQKPKVLETKQLSLI